MSTEMNTKPNPGQQSSETLELAYRLPHLNGLEASQSAISFPDFPNNSSKLVPDAVQAPVEQLSQSLAAQVRVTDPGRAEQMDGFYAARQGKV